MLLILPKVPLFVSGLTYSLNVLCLVGTVYLWGIRRHKFSWNDIGLVPVRWHWSYVLIAIGVLLALLPLRMILGVAIEFIIHGNLDSLQMRQSVLTMAGSLTWLNFVVTLLGAGLLAPISEELYFRGLIHRWFQPRFGFWVRVVLSSTIFGLAHYDSAAVIISGFIMGVALAVAYERSRSIWLPITIHVLNNSLAVIFIYLAMLVMQVLKIK